MRLDCARDTLSAAQPASLTSCISAPSGFILMTGASVRKKSEPGRPTVAKCFAVQHSSTSLFSPTPSEPIADLQWVCMCAGGPSLARHQRGPSKCKNGARSHAFYCARSGQALDSWAQPLPGHAHGSHCFPPTDYAGAQRVVEGDGGAIAHALLLV